MSVSEPPFYGTAESVKIQTGVTADSLGVIETDAELDEFIEDELREATDEINRFCNRTFFEPEEFTETKTGNGSDKLQLRHYPVTELVEINVRGENLGVDDVDIIQRRAFSGENNGVLKRQAGSRPHRNRWNPRQTYEITYLAGYDQPPKTVASVAEDMVIAGIREAIASNALTHNGGASNISMDGFSVTYDVPSALQSGDISETQHKRLEKLQRLGV